MNERDLRGTFALANAFKEGDLLVGGTTDDRLRDEARRAILSATIGQIRRTVLVDDGVTAALERSRDRRLDGELDGLTIARIKSILLQPHSADWARQNVHALTSETIAAVAKVMTDDELSFVASTLFYPVERGGVVIGNHRHFGSRIQPNSAGDDEEEILFSVLAGLSYGCGDVIIGLNPAADEIDSIVRLEQLLERIVRCLDLPTRYCVLSDIVKQQQSQRHTRIDVGFQSLAGTSRALAGMVGLDADGLLDLAQGFEGLYFETGQGSAVTNGAAEGVDMVTLEARAYGLARFFRRAIDARRNVAASPSGAVNNTQPWIIVNDVAGFIGPEVFRTGEQLERACLEDMVMAKLHGITMGLDVCATFHMGIAPAALCRLTRRIVDRAAPAYLMAVAGNADPMLGYLTTSFRDHPPLRRLVRRRITSAMQERLTRLGVVGPDGTSRSIGESVARLYAVYAKSSGDSRTATSLQDEGRRRLDVLGERGLDLGRTDAAADARLEAIYANAQGALYATLDRSVLADVVPKNVQVRTISLSRDDYLAHPTSGEQLRDEDARTLESLYRTESTSVQLVISDGLNANAINEQLRALLPLLGRLLLQAGHPPAKTAIIVQNGRVRVGYEIGGLIGAEVIIHILGERPGTGLNTASAYVTYGRDEAGQSRWSRSLDHSATTAICSIHPRGKPPSSAAAEIARAVARILEQRRSGVALK
jgi:ethanolamine ammonia-lyase large subunit